MRCEEFRGIKFTWGIRDYAFRSHRAVKAPNKLLGEGEAMGHGAAKMVYREVFCPTLSVCTGQ